MFYDDIGEMALGSRLRMLSEVMTKDAQQIYGLYNLELKPKWFPVFYFLSEEKKEKSITEIAKKIRHSHPSVIKIVQEMSKAGLVSQEKDKIDGRKNNIVLTKKGNDISALMTASYIDVNTAIKKTLLQTKHNLWVAIQEFEYLLDQQSLFSRVLDQKKARESKK